MLRTLLALWRDDSGAVDMRNAVLIAFLAVGGALVWQGAGSLLDVGGDVAGHGVAGGREEMWRRAASVARVR